MATNHTENYNLNLWEPTDKFVREEFNENTNKLDAALACHPSAELLWSATVEETEEPVNNLKFDLSNVDWSRYMALVLIVDTSADNGFSIEMGAGGKSIHLYRHATGGMGQNRFTFSYNAKNLTMIVPVFYDSSHAAMALSFGSTATSYADGSLTGGGSSAPLSRCSQLTITRYESAAFAPGDRAVLWGIK